MGGPAVLGRQMESKDLPIPDHGCGGEIMLRESRLALLEILIETLDCTCAKGERLMSLQVAKIGKLLREGECAEADCAP